MPDSSVVRLAVITAAYPSPAEPTRAVFIKNFLEGLAGRGFQMTVVAPRVRAGDPGREQDGPIEIRRFRHPSGNRRLKEEGKPAAWKLGIYCLSGLAALIRAARRMRARAIYAHWALPSGFVGAVAAAALGLPLFVHAHGSDIHRYADSSPGIRRLARWTLRRAALIFSVSRDLSLRMQSRLETPASKIRILPMGIDGRLFKPAGDRGAARRELGLSEDRLELFFAGDLDPWKGILDLARRLAGAADLAGAVRLSIAGGGADRPALEELEKASGGAVRLLGRLGQEAVARWCGAADLLVLPSRGEGMPVSILEALSCGMPVLAAPVGGIPEIIRPGENGWLAESDRFVEEIRRLLREPQALSLARRRLLDAPQDHSAARSAAEAGHLLREALDG